MYFRILVPVMVTLCTLSAAQAAKLDKDNQDNVDIDVCAEAPSDPPGMVCFQAESVHFSYIRERGAIPRLEDFEIHKRFDEDTPALFDLVASGLRLPVVSIDYFRRDTGERFYSMEVTKVHIGKLEHASSTETLPVDVFQLTCASDTSEMLIRDLVNDTTTTSSC